MFVDINMDINIRVQYKLSGDIIDVERQPISRPNN
jgi:hypothetical protein